jgi:hypothetical protein
MNAENPVQIDPFGVSATRTKDTRLADSNGGFGTVRLATLHSGRQRLRWFSGNADCAVPARAAGACGRSRR